MTRYADERHSLQSAGASAVIAASPDLIESGSSFSVQTPTWSQEAWLPRRLSTRASLGIYVVAAAVGWAGIVGLAYGVRALLDEARIAFELTPAGSDTAAPRN